MIGSLAPDVAYAVPRLRLDRLVHGGLGGAVVGLLVGGAMLAVFGGLRGPLTAALPSPHREALWPLCQRRLGHPVRLAVSLVLGSWSHVLWDALTREHHWVTGSGFGARSETAYLPGTDILIARLPWYASTMLGMMALALAYGLWLRRTRVPKQPAPSRQTGRWVAWLLILSAPGMAILPFTLRYAEGWPHSYAVRHFFYVWSGAYLVALMGLLVAVGCGLRVSGWWTAHRSSRREPARAGAAAGSGTRVNPPT